MVGDANDYTYSPLFGDNGFDALLNRLSMLSDNAEQLLFGEEPLDSWDDLLGDDLAVMQIVCLIEQSLVRLT